MRVLLVEDSPTLQAQLSQYISNAGHSVVVAGDGETAVQIMDIQGADLMICDIEMPGLDGFETVSIIRESLGEFWLPIIFLTKKNLVSDFLKGFDVGADDYLIKPVNQRVLHAKMKVMERFIIMQQRLSEALAPPEHSKKFDELTNAYSLEYFNELANLQWRILIRQALPATILIISIDYFAQYREHEDEKSSSDCIKKVAKCLSSSVNRPGDFVGRLSENEFIIMLPETSKSGAEKVSERICSLVESLAIENRHSRIMGVLSVSIGGYSSISLKTNSLEDSVSRSRENLSLAAESQEQRFMVTQVSKLIVSGVDIT